VNFDPFGWIIDYREGPRCDGRLPPRTDILQRFLIKLLLIVVVGLIYYLLAINDWTF